MKRQKSREYGWRVVLRGDNLGRLNGYFSGAKGALIELEDSQSAWNHFVLRLCYFSIEGLRWNHLTSQSCP